MKLPKIILIQCVYYGGIMFGYMPFRFEPTSSPRAKSNSLALAYSIIYSMFLLVLLPILFYYDTISISDNTRIKSTLKIVYFISVGIIVVRTVLTAIQQVLNAKGIVRVINEGFHINELVHRLQLEKPLPPDSAEDPSAAGPDLLLAKIITVVLQFAIVVATLLFSYLWNANNMDYLQWLMFNKHFVNIVMGASYFVAMQMSLWFYWQLNRHLNVSMMSIRTVMDQDSFGVKMQQFCAISDEIDRIDRLYDRVTTFVSDVNRLFSLQLLMATITAFGYALMAV